MLSVCDNKINFKCALTCKQLQEEQDDKEMVSDDFEREKVEARKKSDSVSKARPVSTTSIGSVRHDSVSKRAAAGIGSIAEGEGGDESQVPVEVQSQVCFEYYSLIIFECDSRYI